MPTIVDWHFTLGILFPLSFYFLIGLNGIRLALSLKRVFERLSFSVLFYCLSSLIPPFLATMCL
jgi:hypothetical protein